MKKEYFGKYPNVSKDLVGKGVRILDTNKEDYLLYIGGMYIVRAVRSKQLLFSGFKKYWSCSNNHKRHLFELVDAPPVIEECLFYLDLLEEKLT